MKKSLASLSALALLISVAGCGADSSEADRTLTVANVWDAEHPMSAAVEEVFKTRVEEETGLVPDLNQIQLSPYASRREHRDYHREHGIVTESWSPIGGSSEGLRSDPVVAAIAEELGRTPTQVVLRWHVQTGLVAVPKSGNPGRIAENLDVFGFELSAEQMARLDALDRGEVDVPDAETAGH